MATRFPRSTPSRACFRHRDKHERMNVERGGDRLHLHPTLPAEAHRSQLKLGTVFLDLLRTGARHKTPPVVRWKCLQK